MSTANIRSCFIFVGWESLLLFVKKSTLNGSKEVALAAINCLQTTVLSHSPKVIINIFWSVIAVLSPKIPFIIIMPFFDS